MSSVRKRSRRPPASEDVAIQAPYHLLALATERFEEGSVAVDQAVLLVEHAHEIVQVVEDDVPRNGDEIEEPIAEQPPRRSRRYPRRR